MSNTKIDAKIYEINDGAYFEVKLVSIPRIGELIDFYSFVDEASGHLPRKFYEVVQVVHHITDVSETKPISRDGIHNINIYVKTVDSKSEYFD